MTHTPERRAEMMKLPLKMQKAILSSPNLGVDTEDQVVRYILSLWKNQINADGTRGWTVGNEEDLWGLVRWVDVSAHLLEDCCRRDAENFIGPNAVAFYVAPEATLRVSMTQQLKHHTDRARDDQRRRGPTRRYRDPSANLKHCVRVYIDLICEQGEGGEGVVQGAVWAGLGRAGEKFKLQESEIRKIVSLPQITDVHLNKEYREKAIAKEMVGTLFFGGSHSDPKFDIPWVVQWKAVPDAPGILRIQPALLGLCEGRRAEGFTGPQRIHSFKFLDGRSDMVRKGTLRGALNPTTGVSDSSSPWTSDNALHDKFGIPFPVNKGIAREIIKNGGWQFVSRNGMLETSFAFEEIVPGAVGN
jgi:hypothetical protein